MTHRSALCRFWQSICIASILAIVVTGPGTAGPLDGKTYIIQLSSSQYGSGYGNYLVPPMAEVLAKSGMIARNGPGADYAVNIQTHSDVGKWVGSGDDRVWLYEVTITVGISPASFDFPDDKAPVFGVAAILVTPNSDREDELDCMIRLATRTALARYQPTGLIRVDGSSCLRK